MKHYVTIRLKTSKKSNVLLKLNKINASIKNISYQKEYLVFDILKEDLKKVRKYLISEKIEIISDVGIYKIKNTLQKNLLLIIGAIFASIVFLILSNIIVSVNVIHENSKIRNLLYEALEERGVKRLTFKKSYKEYEKIISDIKNNYKNEIEWLEIDVEGMIINVRVEERIINSYDNKYNFCHVVAQKSGIIKNILTERGIALVQINDYVEKDEVLITGEIKLNEEVKNNVCASGLVYAEVWYNTHVSLPLNYEEKKKTGKMRYNFMVKDGQEEHVILKSRVNNAEVENILLWSFGNFKFYLQKEYEVNMETKKYTLEEATLKAKEQIYEKLALKGIEKKDKITEKVLKKNVINDNLDMDMFITIREQIGVTKYYTPEKASDSSDRKYNGDSF